MKVAKQRVRTLIAGTLVTVAMPMMTLAQSASSQTTLEEITVTAAFREQDLQEVPVSVSAVTGEAITDAGLQKVEDIQFLVPNFSMTETGIATNIFIRGIGSGVNQGFEQSVGMYIDGIHYSRAQQARMPFLDLERIEVLRGPQSILFGKNSVAGALNITTAKPTDTPTSSLFLSQEFEDGETILEGMWSGPVAYTDGRVRGRIAARMRDLDGYMKNPTLGRDEPQREDWAVRGTVEADVTPTLMATLKIDIGEFDVTGRHVEIVNEQPAAAGLRYNQILSGKPPLGFGQDETVSNVVQDEIRSSNGDTSDNESETYALTLDWSLGEFELKSITGYTNFEYEETCDCDYTGANVFNAALQEEYTQFSQELRLSSPLSGSYDYILGAFFQTTEHDYADQINVPTDSVLVTALNGHPQLSVLIPNAGTKVAGTRAARLASVSNDVLSAFAQLNWHFSEALTLQVGGRVTQDDRDGSRVLSIQTLTGGPLPAAQNEAPNVYASGFSITSTNLNDLAKLANNPDCANVPGLISAPGKQAACNIAKLGQLPVRGDRSEIKFSPDLKLVWNRDDNSMLYASWARGFKSGSFDFRANNKNYYSTMAQSFEFEDEENTSIELGGKFASADGSAELNIAAFLTEFKDLQVSIFDGVLGFNVGNAATADVRGLEVDGRWAATQYLNFSGGLAFTDFEFKDFRNGQCYVGQDPNSDLNGDGVKTHCSYTGNSNQMVSDFQGNLVMDLAFPISGEFEFDSSFGLFYTSSYDASATFDPALVQRGYAMFNARIGIVSDTGWEIALLGTNLNDEKILQFGGDTPLAGSSFGAKSNYAFYGRGRMIALQVGIKL